MSLIVINQDSLKKLHDKVFGSESSTSTEPSTDPSTSNRPLYGFRGYFDGGEDSPIEPMIGDSYINISDGFLYQYVLDSISTGACSWHNTGIQTLNPDLPAGFRGFFKGDTSTNFPTNPKDGDTYINTKNGYVFKYKEANGTTQQTNEWKKNRC
jgi:hypothetical protein